MSIDTPVAEPPLHQHVFLGEGHDQSERKVWAVIWLCGAMMCAEIVGGLLFGSIALVADGLHMSTHAGALLLAALAYTYARRHAGNSNFSFGTGKVGDLAGFTSAIVLAMIATLIGYESVTRLLAPVQIHFAEAIPIACLGLVVNVLSAWLLSSGGHHHGHGVDGNDHGHDYGGDHHGHEVDGNDHDYGGDHHGHEVDGNDHDHGGHHHGHGADGNGHDHGHSHDEAHEIVFEEHAHGQAATGHDNNMRAAVIHVVADAAVSVLVIVGLLLARTFGWLWMDPLAGIVGACVIASWSYGLIRDTGAILLDRVPDKRLANALKRTIESDGSTLTDLHLWRLGPGHLGAIVSVCPTELRTADYYRAKLARYPSLSHLTIEISPARTIVNG
jgi:cation diffusion facilitator family transporter